MAKRILLVEDEINIREPLEDFLKKEGFQVKSTSSVLQANKLNLKEFDLVILDWMLPDGQGVDLLRGWRKANLCIPVILLTAKTELIDKVLGLELGADDYMTKPFEPRELLARINARLRSLNISEDVSPERDCTLTVCGIEMNITERLVSFMNVEVDLTKMEFDLLHLFLENRGKVFSREELLNKVWGFDAFPTTRTIDTHILQLRQKFQPNLFETVRGVGYRLKTDKN